MMRKTIILILATLIAASGSEALAQTGNFCFFQEMSHVYPYSWK